MRLAIISISKYPDGDAGAVRNHYIGKIYKLLGYDVSVIGMGDRTLFFPKEYEGIKYYSLRFSAKGRIGKIFDAILFNKRLLKILKKNKYDTLIFYSGFFMTATILKRYAIKNKIRLIYDCVEWYSESEFKMGRFSFFYIQNQLINKKIIDKKYNVICISGFLQKYFSNKGIHTCVIPAIMEVKPLLFENNLSYEKKVNFIYAGQVGKKDLLKEPIIALKNLYKQGYTNFLFSLYGVEKSELFRLFNDDEQKIIDSFVLCFGKKSRKDVISSVCKSDFSILFRNPEELFAKAGFPTKLSESMANGTPVICNYFGDIGKYAIDDYNAIVSKSLDAVEIEKAFRKAINLDRKIINSMKKNAYDSAKIFFDYSLYLKTIELFDYECYDK